MALQHIIIGGLKDGHLLHYDEKLNEERNLYKKIKTILKKISPQSKVCTQSYGPPKLRESQFWEFRDSHLGVLRENDI